MTLIRKVNNLINNGRAYVARRNSFSGSPNDQETEPDLSCPRGRRQNESSNGGEQDHSLSGSWDDCDFDQEGRKRRLERHAASPGRAHRVVSSKLATSSSKSAAMDEDLDWDDETDCTAPAPFSRAPYFSLMRQAEELGAFVPATGAQTQEVEKVAGRSNPVGRFLADAGLRRTVPQPNLASSSRAGKIQTSSVRGGSSVCPVASNSRSCEQHRIEAESLRNPPSEGPSQPSLRRVRSSFSITSKTSNGSWEHLNNNARISTDNIIASPLSGSWTPLDPLIGEKRPGTPWEFVERVKRRRGSVGERVVKFEPCQLEEEVGMRSSFEASFCPGDGRVA